MGTIPPFRIAVVTSALVLSLVTYSACRALPTHAKAETSRPGVCPIQTVEEWQSFLEYYAREDKWIETCEDGPCNKDFVAYVQSNVQETFERCAQFITSHPAIARCTANMRRFTPVWLRQHDNVSYGFATDNHVYLGRQDAADKPEGMMKVPDEIIAALPDRRSVEEAARRAGYKFLTHDSALKGSRTFVLVSDPKGRFDQWMLLNLDGKANSTLKGRDAKMPFSVLVVQKADRAGHKLDHVRIHFRDYTPVRVGKHYKLELFVENNGKCYSCHANGVRQLISRRTPILEARPVHGEPDTGDKDFAYSRLMEFNRRLRSYGAPDWEGQIDPAANGPVLGQAQGCVDCHNGSSRNTLSVFTSPAQLKQKMFHELSMPPDTALPRLLERAEMNGKEFTDDEAASLKEAFHMHAVLLKDFESSRLPALKEWFLETSCR